jgi:hypothetical protein
LIAARRLKWPLRHHHRSVIEADRGGKPPRHSCLGRTRAPPPGATLDVCLTTAAVAPSTGEDRGVAGYQGLDHRAWPQPRRRSSPMWTQDRTPPRHDW